MKLIFASIIALSLSISEAPGHDIYTNLRANGQLCCGGNDCNTTVYRQNGHKYEFMTREKTWVNVPEERIMFLPIPGDTYVDAGENYGHICYTDSIAGSDKTQIEVDSTGRRLRIYCAFIPPGPT